jgi:hypothetical protein
LQLGDYWQQFITIITKRLHENAICSLPLAVINQTATGDD